MNNNFEETCHDNLIRECISQTRPRVKQSRLRPIQIYSLERNPPTNFLIRAFRLPFAVNVPDTFSTQGRRAWNVDDGNNNFRTRREIPSLHISRAAISKTRGKNATFVKYRYKKRKWSPLCRRGRRYKGATLRRKVLSQAILVLRRPYYTGE